MNPKQQNLAIAEACGLVRDYPNYVGDLNAMHEALKTLKWVQRVAFLFTLNEIGIFGEWDILTASPAVLSEAFLRTLGKWVES